jgi:hypothetical protein
MTDATPVARDGGVLDDLRRRLHEASTLLAMGRKSLDDNNVPDLTRLAPMIDELTRDVARLPAGSGRPLRPAMLALLDEVTALSERIISERGRLAGKVKEVEAHRQADAAYRRSKPQ